MSTKANKIIDQSDYDLDVDPHMSMPELAVGVVHQRVFEAFWDGPDTFPTRVVVDDVLN